jgi:hypothetical protein
MSQLRLPGIEPPRQIRPSDSRNHPAFWVRRLLVLRELKPGNDYVVRDVELRRGLNIIWTPSHAPGGGNALFQNGIAGHTAGKTTFCRLLRHVLGERGFATDATRRRIRGRLPAGWVVAEVVVNDETWVVARPLGAGPPSFCIQGGTIAEATDGGNRQDYELFLEAVAAATVSTLPAARFPSSDEPMRWDHVLPWLSRDQECRFADFLEWRHSSSDAETPSLKVGDRQFVVRTVLGLISDEEQAEQFLNAQLVSQKKDAAQREPLLSHQARSDHIRVSNALGVDLAPPSNPLFGSQARAELERLTGELSQREQELANSDNRSELRSALELAVEEETNARRSLEDTEARLAQEQAALGELAGNSQAFLLGGLPPARDYCNQRMSVAREQGCPLAVTRPIDLASRRSERTAVEELELQRQLVQSLEGAAGKDRRALEIAEARTTAARRAFMSAATAFDGQRGAIHEERARLSQIQRLVREAEETWNQASVQAEVVSRLSQQIEESYSRQEQLRNESREAIGRFSAMFDYVVRAIIGEEVTGRVDMSGRSLSLVVEEHGERDSAAIATVKLLAFDLAALTSSVEGHGTFPRFLIHDGPREADLAPDIYERLFLFARELEKCSSGEPSFQYILTTTTRPPDEFVVEPWLRLRLAGVPAEERLLKCDL